jgi:hypothetical protein
MKEAPGPVRLAELVRRRVRLYLPGFARPLGCLSGRLPALRFGSGSNGAGAKRRPPAAGQPYGRAEPGNQPRTRRRNLIALGINPGRVHLATRSRKGYWRMSQNSIVRVALNNRWLEEQGVPDMNALAGVAALEIGEATPPGRSVAKSKQSGPFFTKGRKPASDWNRPVRSRTQGGVGPAAGWVNAQSVVGTRFASYSVGLSAAKTGGKEVPIGETA